MSCTARRDGAVAGAEGAVLHVGMRDPLFAGSRIGFQGEDVEAVGTPGLAKAAPDEFEGEGTEVDAFNAIGSVMTRRTQR